MYSYPALVAGVIDEECADRSHLEQGNKLRISVIATVHRISVNGLSSDAHDGYDQKYAFLLNG